MRASTGVFAGSARGTSRNCKFLSAMKERIPPVQPARVTPFAGGNEADVRRNRFLRFRPIILGRAPQVLDERIDRGRLGLDDPELRQVGAQVVLYFLRPDAAGLGAVA